MTIGPDDQWRIDNARRLAGLRLQLRPYQRWSEVWDHDHCAACWTKFAQSDVPDAQHEGYATCADYPRGACYEWVCRRCYAEMEDALGWSAVML